VTKSSLDPGSVRGGTSEKVAPRPRPGTQRGATTCELYDPGHQIHYKHQGDAVRSPSRSVRDVQFDGTLVVLTLDDHSQLRWHHHDPARVGRLLELLRGKCVVYPDFHAMRIGPYWFNCASQPDAWQDCGISTRSRRD
jgi:hypothetical protein